MHEACPSYFFLGWCAQARMTKRRLAGGPADPVERAFSGGSPATNDLAVTVKLTAIMPQEPARSTRSSVKELTTIYVDDGSGASSPTKVKVAPAP